MYFEDIKAGTLIYLCVRCFIKNEETGTKQLRDITLKTHILGSDAVTDFISKRLPKGYRVCSNIRVDGYLITFDSSNLTASLIVGVGAKTFKFVNCDVATCILDTKKYLCIRASSEGVEFNLRRTVRVNMNNTTANYSVLPSMVQRKCIIRDLSVSGIGLLIDKMQAVNLSDTLQLQFQLDNDGRGVNGVTLYTLTCKVIRIADEGGMWHCGCILIHAPSIDKVVMQRQREDLRAVIR